MNQKTKSLHRDSEHLGVSDEEVWVCGYVHMCTPVERRWGLHMAFTSGWEEGGTQGEVRSCFAFPPKEIRRNKFGFKTIFLFMQMENYLNTYLEDPEKFLSLEGKTDHC